MPAASYTNHLAETPNDSFMKGAEWTAPGKLQSGDRAALALNRAPITANTNP